MVFRARDSWNHVESPDANVADGGGGVLVVRAVPGIRCVARDHESGHNPAIQDESTVRRGPRSPGCRRGVGLAARRTSRVERCRLVVDRRRMLNHQAASFSRYAGIEFGVIVTASPEPPVARSCAPRQARQQIWHMFQIIALIVAVRQPPPLNWALVKEALAIMCC